MYKYIIIFDPLLLRAD